jgi:hypothetical protein
MEARLQKASALPLAFRAKVSSAASDEYAADGCAAAPAWLACALVDVMFQLEEAALAVGINVIGHRRAAKADGMAQHCTQCKAEPIVLGDGDAMSAPARPDAGAKKALIGVNIAHPGKQRLVKERGLDGQAAAAEESDEVVRGDGERLRAWRRESGSGGEAAKFQAAKTARIDEAHLAAAQELQPRMGVRGERRVGSGDQKTPGHAEMDDPLGVGRGHGGASGFLSRRVWHSLAQLKNNVLAGAMDGKDGAISEPAGLLRRRRLKRLRIRTEPRFDDAIAAHAIVNTARDGFHFGQFGHRLIVEVREGHRCETLG